MADKLSKQELDWRAEDDARTMATYQEILSDKARMNRAIKAAQSKATDLNKRAEAMKKVASTKTSSNKSSKKK